MILSQALNTAAMKNANAPVILDLGKTISYVEWKKRVGQLSYLYQAEIGHENRVAFLSQNTPAVLLTFLALSNTGNISFFLDPKDSDEDMVKYLKELEINHMAVGASMLARVNNLIRAHSLAINVIEIEKKKGGEYDPSYSPPPDRPLKETNIVLAVRQEEFGEPTKYIYFNHKQIYLASTAIRRSYHLLANDRIFTSLNWSHPFALIHSALMPMFYGCSIAIDPEFATIEEFVEYLATNHITRFVGTPKYFFQLLAICKSTKYMLPGVKSITVGLGTLSTNLRKTFALLKIPAIHAFGTPESVWTYAMEDTERLNPGRITPYALPGVKYKVLNDAGDEIPGPAFREGPFAFMADFVMTQFFHPDKKIAEKATRNALRGTWFYSGLVARLEGEEEESQVMPLGRQNCALRVDKRYVFPDRIDECVSAMTGVIEAAGFVYVNSKDEEFFACAVVQEGKALAEEAILAHCSSHLQGTEPPRKVFFVDSLPKDRFESIDRVALKRQYSER